MRTVLIGSDFMYDKDGNLKPIEINTAVGWHTNKFESNEESLDLSFLSTFIQNGNFTKVVYIGGITNLKNKLEELCGSINIEYEFLRTDQSSITIPFVEDNDATLIIRSAYDTTALVDDTYCRDKIEFLKLIMNQSFGSQFAYVDEDNNMINTITDIIDNNGHPNFILKHRNPDYDKNIYPKLYKVSTQEELSVVLQNVTTDYFLMPFYYNESNLFQNRIKVFRGLTLLYPPSLESILLGGYTTFCNGDTSEMPEFDNTTFEILTFKNNYTSLDSGFVKPKLEDSDLVQMADGSFKTALDLQVGDVVRTITIPNPYDANNLLELVNYQISFEELTSGTTYSTNEVLAKSRRTIWTKTKKIVFTDNSEWEDTEGSRYLGYRNNEVRFLGLDDLITEDGILQVGDEVILLDGDVEETPTFVKKTVQSIETITGFFGGWAISIDEERLFLTKSPDTNSSFIAIEHNNSCNAGFGCWNSFYCPKYDPYCCGPVASCVFGCFQCFQA
jgi:hypothetical protein